MSDLNTICPYYTMFPLDFPQRIIRGIGKGATTIFDPFAGRGTTLYAARLAGRPAYGIDISPVAVAVSRAKLASATPEKIIARAIAILANTGTEPRVPRGEFWRHAYHADTLRDICVIREAMLAADQDDDVNAALTAIMLGALHGPVNRTPEAASYFSNQMPRTFASKPGYSVKFWKQRKMKPPKVDVVTVIDKRAKWFFEKEVEAAGGRIILGDAANPDNYRKVPEIDLVVTSPPYYGMRTYIQDQWLRNWFLGGPADVDYGKGDQVSHASPEAFARDLASVWDNVGSKANQEIRMAVRFGGIESRSIDPRDIFMDSIARSRFPWKVTRAIHAGTAEDGNRQAAHMGDRAKVKAVSEHDYYVRLDA